VFAAPGERLSLRVRGAAVFATTFLYEARVTLREREAGDRPIR
jgi:hypothetical protein